MQAATASCQGLQVVKHGMNSEQEYYWDTEGKNDPVFLNNTPFLTFQQGKRGKESEEGAQLHWLPNITWAKDGLSEYLTAQKTIEELFYTGAEKNTKLLSWNSVIIARCLCLIREMTHSQSLHLWTQLWFHVCRELLVVFNKKKTTVRFWHWEDVGSYL